MATEFTKIKEPVGFGTSSFKGHRAVRNLPDDVSVIQDSLNQIDPAKGGPSPKLKVNGKIVGPNDPTVLAIRKFQKQHLGFEDGVVDPGNKTEKKLHEVLGAGPGPDPIPPPIGDITIDTVVRIMGQDPSSSLAGTPTAEGQRAIGVPTVTAFSSTVETKEYQDKGFRLQMINFNGGGGRANAASDPSGKIVDLIKNQRKAAQAPGSAKVNFGRVIVFGWSIGGRNAASVVRKLQGAEITVDYLALIDAAFDDQNDAERTSPVVANSVDNLFQAVSNELRGEFPEFEFHGAVPAGIPKKLEDGDGFYRARKERFDNKLIKRKKDAVDCFNDLHEKAVRDGHAEAQKKVFALLKPDR